MLCILLSRGSNLLLCCSGAQARCINCSAHSMASNACLSLVYSCLLKLQAACSFKDFAAQRPLAALVPAEEMGRVRNEIKGELESQAASAAEQPAAAVEQASQQPSQAADRDIAMTDAIPEAGVPPETAAAAAAADPASADGGAATAGTAVTQTEAAEARLADPLATGAAPEAVKADADGDTAMASADGPAADPETASAAEAAVKPEAPAAAAAPADDVKPAAEVAVSDDEVKARWQAGVGALHEVR